MDNYAKTEKLNDEDFKEIIGVTRNTFEAMITILRNAYNARPRKWRGGRKKKLSFEEQLMLTLKYYRSINEQIEKMHKKEDNSSKMSYNGITTNHGLKELLSYEYKYT